MLLFELAPRYCSIMIVPGRDTPTPTVQALDAFGCQLPVARQGGGQLSDAVAQRWVLPPESSSASAVRSLVRSFCAQWDMSGEACHDALVVVSELVSNVVDHAGTLCVLRAQLNGPELHLDVRDFYRCPPPQAQPNTPQSPRGRGLWLVSLLTKRWGVTEFDDGKSVWGVLPVLSNNPPSSSA